MSNLNIQEELLKAMDEFMKKYSAVANSDITGVYKIIDKNPNIDYLYTVTDDSNTFEVRAGNVKDKYSVGQRVFVTIPQGDYSKEKIIIGGYIEDELPQYLYSDPFKDMRWESCINMNSSTITLSNNQASNSAIIKENFIISPSTFDSNYQYIGVTFSAGCYCDKFTGSYVIQLQFVDEKDEDCHPQQPLLIYSKDIPGNPYRSIYGMLYNYVFSFPLTMDINRVKKIKATLIKDGIEFNGSSEKLSVYFANIYFGQNVSELPADGYINFHLLNNNVIANTYNKNTNNNIQFTASLVHNKEIYNKDNQTYPLSIKNLQLEIEHYDLGEWTKISNEYFGSIPQEYLREDRQEESFRAKVSFIESYTEINLETEQEEEKERTIEYISTVFNIANSDYSELESTITQNQEDLEIIAPSGFSHYIYDTNGNKLSLKSYILQVQHKTNNRPLKNGDIVRWLIPKYNTMIKEVGNYELPEGQYSKAELVQAQEYYFIDKTVSTTNQNGINFSSDQYLEYQIKDYYSGAQNNTILCEIIRNGTIIAYGSAELQFGVGNSQGTGYKFNLQFMKGSPKVLGLYQDVFVEAVLYDEQGNKIDLTQNNLQIEWAWYSRGKFLNPMDLTPEDKKSPNWYCQIYDVNNGGIGDLKQIPNATSGLNSNNPYVGIIFSMWNTLTNDQYTKVRTDGRFQENESWGVSWNDAYQSDRIRAQKVDYGTALYKALMEKWKTYDFAWEYVLMATIKNVSVSITEGNKTISRKVNLTAFMPIPLTLREDQGFAQIVKNNDGQSYLDVPDKDKYPDANKRDKYATQIQGPTRIIYNATGTNPKFEDVPYKIEVENNWYYCGNSSNQHAYWKIATTINDNDNFTSVDFNINMEQIKNATESIPTKKSYSPYENRLTAPDTMLTLLPNGHVVGHWDACTWYQPLLITRDNYSYELLNSWSGQTYVTDNAVLSQFMAAGTMGNMNSFTGVMLGSMRVADKQITTNNSIANGLIGMKNGNLTYYLSTDGQYFFGDGGTGYIKFDGKGLDIKTNKILIDVRPSNNEMGNLFYINSTPAESGYYNSWIAAGEKVGEDHNKWRFWIAKDGTLHAKGAVLTDLKDESGNDLTYLKYETIIEDGKTYYKLGDGTKISAEGALVADNAIISGTVYAGGGSIGGWTIGTSSSGYNSGIYKDNTIDSDIYRVGMKIATSDTHAAFYVTKNPSTDQKENIFYVNYKGQLYAKGATIVADNLSYKDAEGNYKEVKQEFINMDGKFASYLTTEDGASKSWVTQEIGDIEVGISEGRAQTLISGAIDNLTLSVSSATGRSSTITLKSNGATIDTATLTISGDVIFKDNLKDGTTQISGDNITTGTINAKTVKITNLSVGSLTAGSIAVNSDLGGVWTILSTSIRAKSSVEIKPGQNATRYTHITPTTLIYHEKADASDYNTTTESILWTDIISKVNAISSGSDERIKKDIEILSDNYEIFFDLLQPKRYKYIDGTSDRYHTGYIAQEVVEALKQSTLDTQQFAAVMLTHPGELNECWHLRRDEFVALNTWQIQKLKARVTELEAKLAALE